MVQTYFSERREAGFKFWYTCLGAALMHTVFFVEFIVFKLYVLALINVISITLYSVFAVISRKTGMGKRPMTLIVGMFAEVLLHAMIVTLIEGIEVSFYLYPLMSAPIYAYYIYCYYDKKTLMRSSIILSVITLFSFAVVISFVELNGELYEEMGLHELSGDGIFLFRGINIVFTMILIVAFVIIFYTEVMTLLGKLRASNEQLNYIATHDALTGLSNRHSLWKYFENLEELGASYCIVMGDLDDFKKINDTYGHDCGDTVLRSVAKIILDSTGASDMACRWGGEEILLVMLGGRDECLARLGEIKNRISGLDIVHEGKPVKVSMTFGFADSAEKEDIITESGEVEKDKLRERADSHSEFDSLISVVDKRLYVGKRSGKNKIIAA